ncbi:MAG: TIGR03016 family PEP-CTERM system-associated outer membrane protein [Burkholderiaceae bacterium]
MAIWVIWQSSISIASAQTWRIEPNSGFANSAETGGDVVFEATPRLAITGRGAGYAVDGLVEADSLSYLRNTLSNEFIPKASVAAKATALDRWLYLDAAAQLEHATANPFSAASSATLPTARQQVTQYRLSPFLDHAFTPSLSLLYRNDNVWTRASTNLAAATERSDTELHSHSLAFTQLPLPFGFSLEANQERTDFINSASSRVELASVRGVLTYAVDPTLILGGVVGVEQNQIASSTSRDTIRGLRIRWRPTERTDLDASAERRFYNNGWSVLWTHRSPFMAMNLNLAKQPASQPSSLLLSNSAGGDLRSLIDSAYSTRFPNPTERAVVVDNAIARLGPQADTTAPIAVFSDYAQLQRSAALSVAFLSPLSVLTLRLFAIESLQLQRPDAPPLPLPPVSDDNAQLGTSVVLNRRLTSTLSAQAAVSGVKIEGRGTSQGQVTTTKSAVLSATRELTPKSRFLVGARRQLSTSNVVSPAQETAAFLGVEHRF